MLAGMEAAGFTREGSLGEPFGSPVIAWMHGQGFPKSLNIAKAIEAKKLQGRSDSVGLRTTNEQKDGPGRVRNSNRNDGLMGEDLGPRTIHDHVTVPEAKKWQGWGTALKPAWEPIITLRKPGPVVELPPLLIPFLYCAKVTKSEADAGIDKRLVALGLSDLERNTHPTRKPVTLMRWLIQHTALSGETVLDPFCGSGSTGVAAIDFGCDFLGIEMDETYHRIAEARIKWAQETSMASARSAFEMIMEMDD
jgi:hypothetical protein